LALYILEADGATDKEWDTLEREGVEEHIQTMRPEQARAWDWDALALGAECLGPSMDRLLAEYRCTRLVVPGADAAVLVQITDQLAALGWRPVMSSGSVFERNGAA